MLLHTHTPLTKTTQQMRLTRSMYTRIVRRVSMILSFSQEMKTQRWCWRYMTVYIPLPLCRCIHTHLSDDVSEDVLGDATKMHPSHSTTTSMRLRVLIVPNSFAFTVKVRNKLHIYNDVLVSLVVKWYGYGKTS
uniref:Glycerol-3-phosphate dehydrogenase [NAD(P)+] n=1 Tax=Lygus hesperus TaxID=30085 RepID=A0A0A9YPX3_LYGHE